MIELTPEQQQIIKHTVGLDNPSRHPRKKGDFYRNRFCAGEKHGEYPILKSLCDLGLMDHTEPQELFGADMIFYLTEAGLEVAKTYEK